VFTESRARSANATPVAWRRVIRGKIEHAFWRRTAMSTEEKDYEAYKAYLNLWLSENPIKTNKLQVLLVVNGLLVSTLQVTGGFTPDNWFLFVAGATFSLIWILSMGRTSLFQQVWQIKANDIAARPAYGADPRFQILNTTAAEGRAPRWLRRLGRTSSKYYLLGAPILFAACWSIALIYVLLFKGAGPAG
jgi:hypothetical protein